MKRAALPSASGHNFGLSAASYMSATSAETTSPSDIRPDPTPHRRPTLPRPFQMIGRVNLTHECGPRCRSPRAPPIRGGPPVWVRLLHQQREAADDQRAADEAAKRRVVEAGVDTIADEDADQHHRQRRREHEEHVA